MNTTLKPEAPYAPAEDSIGHFALEHNVHPTLLPFNKRPYDPIPYITAIRRYFESVNVLKATASTAEIANSPQFAQTGNTELRCIPRPIFHFAGTRALRNKGPIKDLRHLNPHYVHIDSLETIPPGEQRNELLDTFAATGIHTKPAVAPLLGLTMDELEYYIRGREDGHDAYPWDARRRDGIERLARTLKVLKAWTDYSYNDLSYPLNKSKSTLHGYVSNYAADFDVPDDPTRA